MKKIRVMIGVPTMTNRITIQIAGFIASLQKAAYTHPEAPRIDYFFPMAKSPVEYARNVIVGQFLRSDCDKLWFIDEDMLPSASALKILVAPADIVAARMYKFDHPNPTAGTEVGLGVCAMVNTSNGMVRPILPTAGEHSFQEVDAVGTGCTVIARRVLEDRRMWEENIVKQVAQDPYDGNVDDGREDYAPNVFQYHRAPNGLGIMGEDIVFCRKAKALGYKVAVDLNAECGHFKSIDIDQAGYLAQKTVQRVFNGIVLPDGETLKVDFKSLLTPSADKAIHSGDFATKDA